MTRLIVIRLPSTSTVSPTPSPSLARSSGPMRANPWPTSLASASVTRSRTSSSFMPAFPSARGLGHLDLHDPVLDGEGQLVARQARRNGELLSIAQLATIPRERKRPLLEIHPDVVRLDAGHLGDDQEPLVLVEDVDQGLAHLVDDGLARGLVVPDIPEWLDFHRFGAFAQAANGEPDDPLHRLVS